MYNERSYGQRLGSSRASRPCPHRPPCPGCPHYGRAGLSPATKARFDAWCQRVGVDDAAVLVGEAFGYRHRARLAVRGVVAAPKLGLFERQSHRIVDIPHCSIHHPVINAAAAWLRSELEKARLPLYDEVRHTGLLRYVQLAVERPTQRVQVVLVVNAASPQAIASWIRGLTQSAPEFLHSLVFNGHQGRNNAVLGSVWHHLWGDVHLRDTVGEQAVFYPAGAFSQANPQLFDELVRQARSWVGDARDIVELYCGVGGIGLGLVAGARRVVFNELSPPSLRGLELGIAALAVADRRKTVVVSGEAGQAIDHVQPHSCVIADPPRKGLDAAVRLGLLQRLPRRLVYISCGFDSFQRDADVLIESGYRVSKARGAALFPFTDHIEVAACFDLARGNG